MYLELIGDRIEGRRGRGYESPNDLLETGLDSNQAFLEYNFVLLNKDLV